MNVFPEIIGIQLTEYHERTPRYISAELIEAIIAEIKRWPTIKIIELWFTEEKDLNDSSKHIQNLKDHLGNQVALKFIQTPNFFEYSYTAKRDYYREILDGLGYSNIKLLDNEQRSIGVGLGEFSLETNSLFIMISGVVSPFRRMPLEDDVIGHFPNSDFGTLLNNPKTNELRRYARINESNDEMDYLRFIMPESSLKDFWRSKDIQEQITLIDERKVVFGEVLNLDHKVVRVDLGCGPVKRNGFIGVDRFLLPGVDIAADLNKRLPFEDDSVDLVYASHSLEHVSDIMFTMNEIYRICKHGAQICIVVPYSEQKLNYANPYHLQVFNEHTPRFWTDYPNSPIPKEEWVHPQGPFWGLSKSDHSSAVIDLRCVQMHFDYFPEFEDLTSAQKLYERKTKIDVCEQIMYHLVAIKKEISDKEFMSMVQKMEYYEPPYITIRKQKEENLRLTKELDQHKEEAIGEKNTNSRLIEQQRFDVEQQRSEIEQQRTDIEQLGSDIQQLRSDRVRHIRDLEKLEVANKSKETELSEFVLLLKQAEHTLTELQEIRKRAIHLATEKEIYHQTQLNRIRNKLSKSDMWKWVGESFSRLRDDSIIFGFKQKGYKLTLSDNLQNIQFLHYRISNLNGKLLGVYLAISSEINKCGGSVGIEILDGKGSIIQNCSVKISEFDVNLPVYIPIQDTIHNEGEHYHFRVFGSNLEVPVKVYQFAKGKKTTPFMAFNFE